MVSWSTIVQLCTNTSVGQLIRLLATTSCFPGSSSPVISSWAEMSPSTSWILRRAMQPLRCLLHQQQPKPHLRSIAACLFWISWPSSVGHSHTTHRSTLTDVCALIQTCGCKRVMTGNRLAYNNDRIRHHPTKQISTTNMLDAASTTISSWHRTQQRVLQDDHISGCDENQQQLRRRFSSWSFTFINTSTFIIQHSWLI